MSGSGKSTLVNDILYRSLMQRIYKSKLPPGRHTAVDGLDALDKVIDIDQSPIGRTPRSNPATYTGVFDHIRKLFAQTNEAKVRGYLPGRFSFNVKGGRCEACAGDGTIKIEMHFLPDVYVPCEVCKGARYNRDTLDIEFKGKNIAEVLDLSCEEALEFFANQPVIARHMQTIVDVGLGYVRLGQPAPTLSGGEAQRVKLSSELAKRSTGHTIYILDEPTTGLHFEDIRKLLGVLSRLVDQGNTVLVIEHNLDVIKTADWIIDLGPEGGSGGGTVVVEGPPELVAKTPGSHTGQFLAPLAGRPPPEPPRLRRPSQPMGRVLSRAARPALLYAGIARGRRRAEQGPRRQLGDYDYTGSSRFAWSLAYVGHPGRRRLRRRPARPAPHPPVGRRSPPSARPSAGAVGISVVQLLVGDALLPRFVVFGSAAPAGALVPALRRPGPRRADARAERRDRVVVVAEHATRSRPSSRPSSTAAPERPALDRRPASSRRRADVAGAGAGPLVDAGRPRPAPPSSSSTGPPRTDDVDRGPGRRRSTSAGVRVRTLSLFYEEWLGKLPVSELERVSLMFDIGEVHRQRYGRVKRLRRRRPRPSSGLLALVLVDPGRGRRQPRRQPRPAALPPGPGSGKGGELVHDPQVPHDARRRATGLADEWTAEDDPRITRFGRRPAPHPPRRAAPGGQHPPGRPVGRRAPARAAPLRRASSPRSCPFYDLRHLVRPGLTGWAQVKYGYAGDERDALEKLQYEFFYLRHQSLGFDLRIVGRTVRSVIGGDGR